VIQEYLEDLFGVVGDQESDSASEGVALGMPDAKLISLHQQQVDGTDAVGDRSEILPGASSGKIAQNGPEDLCATRAFYNPNEYRWGDKKAVIYDYTLSGTQGPLRGGFERGQSVSLDVAIFFSETLEDPIYGFTIKTVDGRTVFGANTRERGTDLPNPVVGQSAQVHFEFLCSLIPGEYFISVGIAQDDPNRDNVAIDRRYDLIHMPVSGTPGDFGIADVSLLISYSHDD
jgi:lipopolysaccharide transport system ATP-binding protein